MAIAYRSSSAVATGTTSLSIAMPTGTVTNDILVMAVVQHSTTLGFTIADSSWTPFQGSVSTNGYGFFAWKRAGGSEAGPYLITGLIDSCCGAIMSFSGCRLVGSPIGQSTSRGNAAGASGTAGITTTEANCMIVNAACVMDNLALSAWADTNAGTTYVERFDGRTTLGSDTGVGASTSLLATAGATGATSYTIAAPTFENVGLCCSLLPSVAQSIPDDGVPNSVHAHTTSGDLNFGVDAVIQNSSHAHDCDNVALDVMLTVDNSTHAHDATVPTIVHNIVVSVYTHLFCWLIAAPAIGGIPGPKIPNGCSCSELSSYVTAAGKTVTFNIEERTDQDSAGTDIKETDQVADDNGATTGTFANKYLAKDNYLWVDISAVDAGAENLSITLACTDETNLVLADVNHGHSCDNVVLTQAHDLEVQSSDHAHDVGNISIDPILVVNDTVHGNVSTTLTLIENQAAISGSIPGFWTWIVSEPIEVGGIPGPKVPEGATIASIQSYVTPYGEDPSATFNIEIRTTSLAPGVDIMAEDMIAIPTGAYEWSFASDYVEKDKFLWLDISATTGLGPTLMVTVSYLISSFQEVESCVHAHAVDNIALDVDLTVNNSSHAHSAEDILVDPDYETPFGIIVDGFYTWVIENPRVGVVPGPKVFTDIVIEDVSSYVTAGTSATFNLESRGDHSLPGLNVLSAEQIALTTGNSVPTIGFWTWVVSEPLAVGGIPGPKVPSNCTITSIDSYVTPYGDTPSATFNVERRATPTSSGTNIMAEDMVAIPTGANELSFASGEIKQGEFLWLDISAFNAIETTLMVTVAYQVTADLLYSNNYVSKDRWLFLDVSEVSWLDEEAPGLLEVTVAWKYNQGGVNNCEHALTSDNVDLVADEDILLTVAACIHANTADSLTISQYLRNSVPMELIVTPVMLVVADSSHGHTTGSAILSGATRIYFPSSGTSSVSPGINSYWDETVDSDTINATMIKGTTALADKSCTSQNSVPTTVLNRAYVLGDGIGLEAHSYSTAETFDFVVRCSESDAAANSSLYLTINAEDITGATNYGEIYSGIINGTELDVALESRFCSGRVLTGTVNAPGGHILVFGIGPYSNNVTGDEYTITMSFGDLPSTALSLNNIDTDSDYPYLEFNFQLSDYSVPLLVDDVTHAHTVDGDLVFDIGLTTASCTHANDCDAIILTGISNLLVVENCTHAHQAASVDFPITVQGRRLWVKVKGHWVQITPATGE